MFLLCEYVLFIVNHITKYEKSEVLWIPSEVTIYFILQVCVKSLDNGQGSESCSCTYPPVGVISGHDYNDLIFEKGKLLRTDCSAVH